MIKITEQCLRKIIREEIGRNWHTKNNDPFSYEDYEEFEINSFPDASDGTYVVYIEVPGHEHLNSPQHKFVTEEEANMFARQYVEKLKREFMAQEL